MLYILVPDVDPCLRNVCITYLQALRLNIKYFNRKHNKCFCPVHYESSKPNVLTVAGSEFTVPRGWASFAIHVDKGFATNNKIFTDWFTTFYGTSHDKLEDIIHNRFVPFPGDDLLTGKKFILNLSDQHHIYTSPSINQASLKHIAPIHKMTINNVSYDFQVVLQCKQNPTFIKKFGSNKSNVCPHISSTTIQWKTDQRSSVVPISLLIRAKKSDNI